MKRIFTIALLTAFAASSSARNTSAVTSHTLPAQKYTPTTLLQPDEYMQNTLIIKVLPQFRAQCTNEQIAIPSVQNFFTMIGVDNIKKIYPNHKTPEKAVNKYGAPMMDLSLIYEVHYSGALALESAIAKLYNQGFFEFVEPHYIPKIDLAVNDPKSANNTTNNGQYHLYITNCAGPGTTGWDISTGAATTLIAIVDTGTEYTHADLTNQVAINAADPVGSGDQDGDGFVDNYRGWDVAMNDNDATWQGNAHGVHVSGCASAQCNNSVGLCGSGYNCKFVPVKIADASGSLTASYEGITYAADFGCSVINCSWGGGGGGSYGQTIIDYAVNNRDALVIAAAGNNGLDEAFYPAAYDKVLSVGATTNTDARAGFSNYNYTVDICSPGNNVNATWVGSSYAQNSGTSMASPVCAGIAGIVRTYFPSYSALQVGERLKATSDNIYSVPGNTGPTYADKLGTGRVNLYRALTDPNGPAIVYSNMDLDDLNDLTFVANDTIRVTGDFTNYLGAATNLVATLTVVSGGTFVSILDGTTTVGALGTMATANHTADPFQVKILPTAPVNQPVTFKLNMMDGAYSVNQYFTFIVNVDYINITINDVWTTITSKGLIGYNQPAQTQGLGFDYLQAGSLMYESSLMIGSTSSNTNDMVRGGTPGNTDVDFASQVAVRPLNPLQFSDFDVDGKFRDNVSATPLPVTVHHQAYAWSATPHRKYVIVKYVIANTGPSTLSNVYAGIFSDWDIDAATFGMNRTGFDAANKMGYSFYTGASGKYCGIKLLTNTAPVNHYAIDNVTGGGGGIDIYDGYSQAEKYTSMSTSRAIAGATGNGADVCDVVSSGPFTIASNDSIVVAFALIAGDDLSDLQASAVDAQTMWDGIPTSSVETVSLNAAILNAFPNPASGNTQIQYSVAEAGYTELRIVDATGRLVSVLGAGQKSQGNYTVELETANLPEGMYLIQLLTSKGMITRKLIVSH
ncbi:MAG: S8 family peptidase [Bacteroidota bacterium]|nr:S8 family peptidase [Bacteroidota bacterium]